MKIDLFSLIVPTIAIVAVGTSTIMTHKDRYPDPVGAVAVEQYPGSTIDYSPDREHGASGPDDYSLMWSCSRTNSNGSGTVPCIIVREVNNIVFNFTDDADITFWHGPVEGNSAEVSGVQAEGSYREQAFGFCEFVGDGARCRASNGPEMVEYEAR